MIVVAIIGLLAALAVPGFVKARKQSQGRRIMNDARQMDSAVDQWAIEFYKTDGSTIDTVGACDLLENGMEVERPAWPHLRSQHCWNGPDHHSDEHQVRLDGVGIDWGVY